MTKEHWIDNADSYICPVCGFETSSPAKYTGCICPECGFQDKKDRESSDICVCCGDPVPEGRMVCWACEHKGDVTMKKVKRSIPHKLLDKLVVAGEDGTAYLCLFGRRLVWRDGRYEGWYRP